MLIGNEFHGNISGSKSKGCCHGKHFSAMQHGEQKAVTRCLLEFLLMVQLTKAEDG